jgi:hypothetical protein
VARATYQVALAEAMSGEIEGTAGSTDADQEPRDVVWRAGA